MTIPSAAQAFNVDDGRRCIDTPLGSTCLLEAGSGPETIVLLHGISSGAGSWASCVPFLAPHARVIAWDAPGYGKSSPLPVPTPKATDYALRLAALVEALDIDRFLLVGHSLGALMAAGYSHLPDARARAYVLFSPALGYGGSDRAASVRQGRLDNLDQNGIAGIAAALPTRLLSAHATPDQMAAVTSNALQLDPNGYRQAVELLCGDDIHQYTALNADNAQVWCGDLDGVTPPEQSRAFAKRTGLPFGLITQAGHACYVEQPEQVAEKILMALTKTRSRHET